MSKQAADHHKKAAHPHSSRLRMVSFCMEDLSYAVKSFQRKGVAEAAVSRLLDLGEILLGHEVEE